MKRSSLLCFTIVKRGYYLFIDTKLLLCLLISVSVGLISGCERDIEDLSKEDLVICWLTINDSALNNDSTLDVQQTAKLTAELEYSGDDSELRYNWTTKYGEIYNNGQHATYVAPEKAGTYTIKFEVCNGAKTVSDAVSVTVIDPDITGQEMPGDNTSTVDPTTAGNPATAEKDDKETGQPVENNQDEDKPANAEGDEQADGG